MTVKSVLKELNFSLEKNEMASLRAKAKDFVEILKKGILKERVDADVFVGGSIAKGTLAKAKEYDVDIFVRFDWQYEDLSYELKKIMKHFSDEKIETLHGSRDYFRIRKGDGLTFEIIPVLRIKKVGEARNITDQSYFHVNYVKKNFTQEMARELSLAKKFCQAQGVYGAESYIHGFSGYSLECLIIHYKTFEKMLRELVKVRIGERAIIDPAKYYKRKDDIVFELNESKIQGPLVLVDPTWKDRNVLAGLNRETFEKFKEAGRKFLDKPTKEYFEVRGLDVESLKKISSKKKAEFVHVVLETDRQEGDIAGTKMKKFSRFLLSDLKKYFNILSEEFDYSGEGKEANYYLVLKSKGEILKVGPPLKMKDSVRKFKEKNSEAFEKNGYLHARVKVDFSGKEFLEKFKVDCKDKVAEMGIVKMGIS